MAIQKNYNSIPLWCWTRGSYALFTYDISSAGTANTGMLSQPHTGPLEVVIEFNEQLTEGLIVALQSMTPRSWKYNAKGEVSVL